MNISYLKIPTYWENKKQNEEILKLNEKDLRINKLIQILKDGNETNTEITIEDLLEVSKNKDFKKEDIEKSLYKLYKNYKIKYENNKYII